MSRNTVRFASFFVLLIGGAHAQFNSVIQGTVIDSSGGVVPGATVRATNAATGIVRQTITSGEGIYFVVSLPPGRYRVTAEKPGFATAGQEGVELAGSETIRVDLVLQVGSSTANIRVAEHAALVETEEGRVSGRIDSLQLTEMPLNGGNVYTLLALQPGIIGTGIMGSSALGGSDSFTAAGTPGVYASGQRLDSNGYSVDNTSVDSTAGGGVTYLSPNPESVEEISVVANNFSAAEGRTASAQIRVITKSGGNEFHGGASYYFENNTLSSRNEFATTAASLPVFRRNEFGAHFGGPIIRNRTFFFVSYEGLRSSGARGASEVVETPAFRNFVESTEPNSIAARVLRVYQPLVDPTYNFKTVVPNPGPGVTPIIPAGMLDIGTANYVPYAFRNGNQYNVRIDHELRPDKDRLYGSIYRTPSRSVTGDIRPADNRPTSQASDFASFNYTHIFSPHFINEFRAGVARTISNQDLPPHPEVPSLTITGLTSVISQNFFPSKYAQTGFNYSDMFSLVRSSHSLKMGAEVRRTWSNSYNTRFFIPNYNFYSIVDFADNDPYQETRTVDPRTGNPATAVVGMRDTEFALFVNDDWKVTRNFTVNVGLRYENYGSPTEVNGLLRNIVFGPGSDYAQSLTTASAQIVKHFYPTGNLDFAPRLGLAWNPDGKGRTAVRGGYGIAYNKLGDTALLNFRGNPPLDAIVNVGRLYGTPFTYSLGGPSAPYLGYPVDPDLRQGLNAQNGINGIRASLYGVDPKFAMAYTHNWFFGIQHGFGAGWTLDVNYLGTSAHHLPIQINMNRFAGDLLHGGIFHGLNQSFADIQMVQSTGNSIYNGMTAHLKHVFGHGFNFDAAYTFGKAIDDADVVGSSTSGNPTYVDVNNRALERGPTGYDVRQKLAFSGVWQLPFFKGQSGIAARALGHWEFTGIGILQSGTPIDVTSSASFPKGDWNADGQNGDRPDAPGPVVQRNGFSRSAFLTGIFTAAQFPSPTLGADGTLGRNVFRGPGFAEVDLLVSRKFRVSERFKAELRGEAFNAFNRVNLANPVTDLSSTSFGRSTSQLTPRQYQLVLRVSF